MTKAEKDRAWKAIDGMTSIANKTFKEREDIVSGIIMSFITGNHILLIGPPGTAKSQLANSMSGYIQGARYFYWLVTKYSVPEELFGPPSIAELEKGKYKRITTNKLPEAEFAFIDEIFKSSSSILNCLLTIMNERLFFDGDSVMQAPLITMIGASNELPTESEELAALYDRFLLRYEMSYIKQRSNLVSLLTDSAPSQAPIMSIDDMLKLREDFAKSDIPFDIDFYIDLRNKLAEQGITVSDRRFKQMIKLVQCSAYLNGRADTIQKDFYILKNAFWSEPSQIPIVGKTINELINPLMQLAIEKFDEAREVYDNCMKLVASEPGSAMLHAAEAHSKLKSIKEDVEKEIANANGSDTSELKSSSERITKEMVVPLVKNVMKVGI